MLSALRQPISKVVQAAPIRGFASSSRQLDLSKVTLIGRLGSDPQMRTTSSGKPYYTYNVATATGPPKEEDGRSVPSTSWHSVYAFNENSHAALARVGKGSTVYVEADIEMRPTQAADGATLHDRALLRHPGSGRSQKRTARLRNKRAKQGWRAAAQEPGFSQE